MEMELHGEDRIFEAFNDWLRKYEFAARVESLELDFGFYRSENSIAISFTVSEDADTHWRSWTKSLGFPPELDLFWTSFLHELGHSETIYEMDKQTLDECALIEIFGTIQEYLEMPREIAATLWARDFCVQNPEAVHELVDTVRPHILQFFADNDISLE